MKRVCLQQFSMGVVLLAAGVIAGTSVAPSNEARGQARSTPPAAFQSGGQLSVPILQSIAGTLQQIDARLARLEIVAQKLQAPRRTTGD